MSLAVSLSGRFSLTRAHDLSTADSSLLALPFSSKSATGVLSMPNK
ncbi:hypothetical protein H3L98_09875 [Conchiformibius steedae]|nr:hypothetical protein H3L98_09875 [Conchiformibius steedae]